MIMPPNEKQLQFLNLAYNRFYDLYDEVLEDSFWDKSSWERFSKIKQGFAIYSELLYYAPIKMALERMKTSRPPMEAEISKELFKFIRNVVFHFPFFTEWKEVWFNSSLINWCTEGLTIDKFLKTYSGQPVVKYRFWEERKKRMTYLQISFPDKYEEDSKIFLNDIISEKEGVPFAFILMKKILNTQVESDL